MLRTVRERVREKLGRALQEYVVTEIQREGRDQRAVLEALRADVERLTAEQRSGTERSEAAMRAWERRQRRDVITALERRTAETTATFVHEQMERATPHFAKDETMAAALAAVDVTGLYLEFGVASGGTLRQIASTAPAGAVFGFDSFEGLPEKWRAGFEVGAFAMEALPEVEGAELVVGWFDQTLPAFLAAHPEPVAFLHLDADLYSSTVTVLEALQDRLQVGTVVMFDEYFNYPGWEEHEHRAWVEFVDRAGVQFEYLGFTADDEQLSLRITALGGTDQG
ncbi:class I SAM-dependent methyltransferase [Klenkia terrae]|uniref:Class I SAM-dependent methyltransferase n=1 Tax=Klenkia terrae TaxID=1052259 RepID=A0ABU8ECI5_9ACTN